MFRYLERDGHLCKKHPWMEFCGHIENEFSIIPDEKINYDLKRSCGQIVIDMKDSVQIPNVKSSSKRLKNHGDQIFMNLVGTITWVITVTSVWIIMI
eukprot:UN23172